MKVEMEFQADELDSLESSFPYKDFYTGAHVVSEQRKKEKSLPDGSPSCSNAD